jgi:hypothetical protein
MGNVRLGRLGWCLVVGLLLLSARTRAQTSTTGAIYGVVRDAATNEPIVGVTILVSSPAAGATQSALTDDKGTYKITDLAPGEYLVTFYYLDFTVERAGVPVGVQKVTPVYQKLDTSAATGEVVRIEGTTPTIDPTSTAQGITIDKNYLKHIPVPGRTFEAALGAAAGSQGDGIGVAFSGSTSLENQYYVDGVNTTGLTFGTVGSPVINDFIEEIEIITGGYNAEYGRATGGIVNVVTKSGSNEIKGSVFGYWQPGQLTAQVDRTPINAASLEVRGDIGYRADFGVELGGPIIKDKLWFFIGMAPQFVRIDYTREIKRQTDCRRTLDDGTLSPCDPRIGDGYADGAPDIDPETGFFITDLVDSELRAHNQRLFNMLGKINYAYSPEQQGQLSVQLLPGQTRRPGLFGTPTSGNRYAYLTSDVSAKWTSKFNNNKTEVEAVIGVHRQDFHVEGIDPMTAGTPIQVLRGGTLGIWGPGFGESPVANEGCFDGPPTSRDPYPFITNCPMSSRSYVIGGPGSLARDMEQRTAARVGLTQRLKAGGTHEIKAGIDIENNVTDITRSLSGNAYLVNSVGTSVDVLRWVQITTMEDPDPRFDQTCYTSPPPTDPMAQTAFRCDHLGAPGTTGTINRGNTLNWAAYVRDSWQIRPNLTLNAGLRMEEQRLRYAEYLQHRADPATGVMLGKNALVIRGELSPRIGLLYDWTKEGRSKAYAHWGRFYESIPMAVNEVSFGMPVLHVQSYSPGLCSTMVDPRIGGADGTTCLDTTQSPDQREELFGVYGSIVAPGVKGQYLDELIAGVEYEIVDDLKLGVAVQDRRFGRVIEDISTDGANTYVLSNPGEWSSEEEEKFQRKIDQETDPAVRARLMRQLEMFRGIRNFDRPRRDYTALQFTMTRRFSKHLYMQGSYTYSRTLGNYPGLVNYDDGVVLPNNSTQYDLIELLANRIGPLPQDRPHYIKLDGYYNWDLRRAGLLTTGIRFRALSGAPRNALGAHYLYGDDQAFLLPRGSIGRASFEHGLDVHIGYGRKLARNTQLELFVDLYNIYNNQGTAAVDNTYASFVRLGVGGGAAAIQSANPVSGGTFEDLIWVKVIDRNGGESPLPIGRNPNFGNTVARYGPMFARLGARLTF